MEYLAGKEKEKIKELAERFLKLNAKQLSIMATFYYAMDNSGGTKKENLNSLYFLKSNYSSQEIESTLGK